MAAETLIDDFVQLILDDYTASRRAGVAGSDAEFHITRTPLSFDRQGLAEALQASEEHRLRMAEIAAGSVERHLSVGGEEIRTSSSIVFFKLPSST
jgi:hypothetical protein